MKFKLGRRFAVLLHSTKKKYKLDYVIMSVGMHIGTESVITSAISLHKGTEAAVFSPKIIVKSIGKLLLNGSHGKTGSY